MAGHRLSNADDLRIRAMRPDEMAIAADWAAAEGWNPGLADAACFATVDAGGFLIGELDGAPAATISCVNYDDRFAFLGFYIVRPDLRGRGYGLRIWNAAVEHAGDRIIGLDGVVAQQDNYQKSGFRLAYPNVRYGGRVATGAAPPGIIALADVPFALVEADDATVFPAPRTAFLRAWIETSGHVGRALVRDGRLVGLGRDPPVPHGLQDRPAGGRRSRGGGGGVRGAGGGGRRRRIFLDVPSVNRDAVALAGITDFRRCLRPRGCMPDAIRPLRLERVFGVTTFELG